MCFDGKVRLGTIRGKMRRRVYIFANDIILVGLRDFQDEKCDVIWKYYPEEAKTLKAMGEIPEHTQIDDKNKDPAEGEVRFYKTVQTAINTLIFNLEALFN